MLRSRRGAPIIAALALLGCCLAPAAAGAVVRNYNLGDVTLPESGPEGPLPVRLWGAVGVPAGPGPHPLVVVAHGRHGDNCPSHERPDGTLDFEWPCYGREQRNDLGLRHVVAALARRGVAAIAPDLNGAYTIGWGPDANRRRWARLVGRTLAELAHDVVAGGTRFGIDLHRRIALRHLGLLGHSRSGLNAVLLARSRAEGEPTPAEVRQGKAPFQSLFLLAPVYEGVPAPDLTTAVVASGCDGDVPGQAKRYLAAAERTHRDRPLFLVKLRHANHNFYNRTLARLGRDDGRFSPGGRDCRRRLRLRPAPQQAWIDTAAGAFFDATLDGARRPRWMRASVPPADRLYGQDVIIDRLFP